MIRLAKQQDCINLAALSIKVWLDNYAVAGIRREFSEYVFETFTEAQFIDYLNDPHCRILVCEEHGALQGYALLNLHSHYESVVNGYEVQRLYIDSRFKQQGIGKALLSELKQQFGQPFWLYTWVENAANGFYQHLGFERIGRIDIEISEHTIENIVYRFACEQP
ncbi:GNAT family N-acetyltransferase [Vibrio palustris]|uniref:Putative acetyltransferase n=1 Tax=Vibrio palustris TaxID=1918946 RepID=A0A1R4B4F7_9VIBR|nr:GNAT family N-acetyltransferase [Vibrio palustris]SJL83781.1 putative acetyltransferase [Vibrio palustris]